MNTTEIARLASELADAQFFRRFAERIWNGRRAMHRVNLDPERSDPPIQIVVSAEMFEALTIYSQRRNDPLDRTYVPLESYFELTQEMKIGMRMFGLTIVADGSLMPQEIRFRSEITL